MLGAMKPLEQGTPDRRRRRLRVQAGRRPGAEGRDPGHLREELPGDTHRPLEHPQAQGRRASPPDGTDDVIKQKPEGGAHRRRRRRALLRAVASVVAEVDIAGGLRSRTASPSGSALVRACEPLPVTALALALLGLAAWRAACVLAGPDIDTDAYAHHMIARAILADPHDLAVHWVWLPLFHYLQVPLVALGGTMNDVRWANVALVGGAARRPLRVRARAPRAPGRRRCAPSATALLAALFAGACPIVDADGHDGAARAALRAPRRSASPSPSSGGATGGPRRCSRRR